MKRRSFGTIRRLPSKNYQALYYGPDFARHKAGRTFDRQEDAETWLTNERLYWEGLEAVGKLEDWKSPAERKRIAEQAMLKQAQVPTLTKYSEKYLKDHPNSVQPIRPSTLRRYNSLLRLHILPELGSLRLPEITKSLVVNWRASLDPEIGRTNDQAYSLLHAIMEYAVHEEIVTTNPCTVKRGGKSSRHKGPETLTEAQVDDIVKAMPERYKLAVAIGAWCGLRSGEVRGLQRGDISKDLSVIHVRRGVTDGDDGRVVGVTKTPESIRDAEVPVSLRPLLKRHLNKYAQIGDAGLLFYQIGNGGYMSDTHLGKIFSRARNSAGVDGFTFHDLRAFALTVAAEEGATIRELQAIAGHATPNMAMRYQRINDEHKKGVVTRMGERVGPTTREAMA